MLSLLLLPSRMGSILKGIILLSQEKLSRNQVLSFTYFGMALLFRVNQLIILCDFIFASYINGVDS